MGAQLDLITEGPDNLHRVAHDLAQVVSILVIDADIALGVLAGGVNRELGNDLQAASHRLPGILGRLRALLPAAPIAG